MGRAPYHVSFFLIRRADLDEAEGLGRKTEDKKAIHLTRLFGYALSSIAAFVLYGAWVAATVPGPASWSARIFGALFLCLFGRVLSGDTVNGVALGPSRVDLQQPAIVWARILCTCGSAADAHCRLRGIFTLTEAPLY